MVYIMEAIWAGVVLGLGLFRGVVNASGGAAADFLAAAGELLPLGPHFIANALKIKGSFLLAAALLLACDGLGLRAL